MRGFYYFPIFFSPVIAIIGTVVYLAMVAVYMVLWLALEAAKTIRAIREHRRWDRIMYERAHPQPVYTRPAGDVNRPHECEWLRDRLN